MDLIRGVVVNAPFRMGDVVLENLLNTNIDLIASMNNRPCLSSSFGSGII